MPHFTDEETGAQEDYVACSVTHLICGLSRTAFTAVYTDSNILAPVQDILELISLWFVLLLFLWF